MSELLRELEEDLRNERLQKLWHSFGRAIVGLSLAIILGTVAVVSWQHYQRSKAAEMTGQLLKGIDRLKVEDYQGAVTAFDAVGGAPVYRALAMLYKAEALAALDDKDAARKTYEEAGKISASGNGSAFVELARLRAGDVSAPAAASPFSYSQTEQYAWQQLKEGKKDEAARAFMTLRDDENAPYALRQRATAAFDYLTPKPKP